MKGKILLSLVALLLVSGSLTAFASSTETPDISIEQSAPMQLSTVMIRQDEDTLTSSYDDGTLFLMRKHTNFIAIMSFPHGLRNRKLKYQR